jgi:hydrophobic/amphiphilic exporter-1 (mainly G- bacteria), HAE1 family
MASISYYAIRQRVTTVMICLGIVFFGLIAIYSLKQDLFPPLKFPQVTVVTEYVNAAPEEIETLITRPLEETISSTSGLRKLESISEEGRSTIFASFGWNENIDFAALSVREKIDLVKERLPKESEDPIVLKFDPLDRPVMILSVTGKIEPIDLKILSERIIKDNLEKVEGVASATISGGRDREIQVELDQGRLSSAEVSILDVIDAIDNSNISYPAGSIKKGLYEYLIRTVGEFRSVSEIAYTVVSTDVKKRIQREPDSFVERSDDGMRESMDTSRESQARAVGDKRLILVRDIGAVHDTVREQSSISRYNQEENVSVAIRKQGSANAVEVAERVRLELKFLNDELEARGMEVDFVYDHSKFIKRVILNMRNAAILGGAIAALVLFFFFRNWKSAFIVGLTIPISVMGTFFLCQMHGISINMMSLGGLALGAGMIVDNAIVVIENIFRMREKGLGPEEAAEQGANEVFWPVFSSTLTTVAVFFPLIVFTPGVVGQLFEDLSWSVIYSLSISLLVAYTLVPMLAAVMDVKGGTDRNAVQISQDQMEKIKLFFLGKSKKDQNKILMRLIGAAFLLFIGSVFLLRSLDTEVLPKVEQEQFLIRVDLPVGSRLEATDQSVKIIEDAIRKIAEIKSVQVTIGSASSSKSGEIKIETLRAYQALILVTLHSKRKRSAALIAQDLRDQLEKIDIRPAVTEFILEESEFAFAAQGGKPIEVEIKGYDLATITGLSEQIAKMLKGVPGVYEVLSDLGEPSPETRVEIDRKRSALYAISARDISLTAKAGIEGAIATVFKEEGKEIDVRVRLREKDRESLRRVGDLLVYSNALEVPVPLKEVGTIKQGYGPSEIRRKDQIRAITVRAGIQKGVKEKTVLQAVEQGVLRMEIPKDYTVDLVGKAREVRESFRRIVFAIALAFILIYMIMAAQFESFLHPLIVMVTVPLSMVGVTVALWITGTPVSVIALLGLLILVGTVVNNSIVLVDFINRSRSSGMDLVEACVTASLVRLRPILMATLTTVMGLVPLALALGDGTELQSPLAIAMIGGLLSATFFTICVIPAVYIMITRAIEDWFGIKFVDEEL